MATATVNNVIVIRFWIGPLNINQSVGTWRPSSSWLVPITLGASVLHTGKRPIVPRYSPLYCNMHQNPSKQISPDHPAQTTVQPQDTKLPVNVLLHTIKTGTSAPQGLVPSVTRNEPSKTRRWVSNLITRYLSARLDSSLADTYSDTRRDRNLNKPDESTLNDPKKTYPPKF